MIPETDRKKLKNIPKKTHSEYWAMIWLGLTKPSGASKDNGIHHFGGVGFKYFLFSMKVFDSYRYFPADFIISVNVNFCLDFGPQNHLPDM